MKYFLVEADGRETLAAYADESTPGDSHYTYKNCEEFTSFGTLCCHNRKALHSWLDSIVRASSGVVTTGPISTAAGKNKWGSG